MTRRGSLFGGLAWDSRDNEWSPAAGGLHDASVEVAGPWSGASSTWVRLNASFRWYRALGTDKVVFAQQLLLDALLGDAPFVAQGEFGGFLSREGIGGRYLGRGYFRRRFIGSTKAYASTGIRVEPWEFRLGTWTLTPGIKGFFDVGKVFAWSESIVAGLRPSGGPGAYFVWDRFMVMRADVGFSPEGVAVVVVADHAF